MVFECSAIILIILILSVLILRSGSRSGWGVAVLPLLLVPAGHIARNWLVPPFSRLIPADTPATWIGFELITLAITCLLLGLISYKIKRRSAKLAYLVVCGGFSAILTCVLIVRTVL